MYVHVCTWYMSQPFLPLMEWPQREWFMLHKGPGYKANLVYHIGWDLVMCVHASIAQIAIGC